MESVILHPRLPLAFGALTTETYHKPSYNMYLYCSISCLPKQELVLEQELFSHEPLFLGWPR